MKPWKRISPTTVTKIGYRNVVVKYFEMPDGSVQDWTVMNEDGWACAGAIALTTDNMVILARQFRPGPEKIMSEIPGGIVDPGETPEQCVVREFAEETGYKAGKVEYLGVAHHDAYMNGDWHYFFITGCTPTGKDPDADPTAPVEVELVSIDELLARARSGQMTDPAAVLMAYETLKTVADEQPKH